MKQDFINKSVRDLLIKKGVKVDTNLLNKTILEEVRILCTYDLDMYKSLVLGVTESILQSNSVEGLEDIDSLKDLMAINHHLHKIEVTKEVGDFCRSYPNDLKKLVNKLGLKNK